MPKGGGVVVKKFAWKLRGWEVVIKSIEMIIVDILQCN